MNKNDPPLNEPGLVLDQEMEETLSVPKKTEKRTVNGDQQPPPRSPVEQPLVDSNANEEVEFVVESEEEFQEIKGAQSTDLKVVENNQLAEKPESGRIGDRLIAKGLITPDQLNVALQEKRISGKMLGEALVDLGFIDADTLSSFLAKSTGHSVFDPKSTIIEGDAVGLIDKKLAEKHLVLPFSINGDEILVAMADPYDVVALDNLKKNLPKGLKVKPSVTTPSVLSEAIHAAYGYASSVADILKELEARNADELDVTQLNEDEVYSHPVVRLVNALIFDAVKIGASDLHFEPEENFIRLRYRVDGVLHTAQILHRKDWIAIAQRIKIMAELNIANKLSPQDGRINMSISGRSVDFRVSSLPTVFGENIVMRVLDKQSSIMPLSGLGFNDGNMDRIQKGLKRPEGIIIVTGPTGSGKTTTLYSMLNEINSVDVDIQTLEDPVEYSLPLIRQTAVKEGVLEFADGIRALLRQDPDIIFIGEIRDQTTAEMALQAAMTGHQVFTSLHTNDSFGALPRLFDLGLVPGMIAGNIISVFAQRLTRILCSNCKEPYKASDEECQMLGVSNVPEIFKARQGGCDACNGQGYKGRIAIAEILLFDEEIDEIVARGGTKAEIKEIARAKGFKNMRDDAMLKILEGKTTFDAVAKVVDVTR